MVMNFMNLIEHVEPISGYLCVWTISALADWIKFCICKVLREHMNLKCLNLLDFAHVVVLGTW